MKQGGEEDESNRLVVATAMVVMAMVGGGLWRWSKMTRKLNLMNKMMSCSCWAGTYSNAVDENYFSVLYGLDFFIYLFIFFYFFLWNITHIH